MIFREIALAAMVGVLIVIGLAVALIRKWARSNEEDRQRSLPPSLRGH